MQINKVLLLGATGKLGHMLRVFWPDPQGLACQSGQARPGFIAFDPALDPDAAVRAAANAAAIICLSGVTPARVARTKEAYSCNTDLALAALDLGRRVGCRRVFLASSAAVYGAQAGVLQETAVCAPVSDYGRAKLAMEDAALALSATTGQAVTILRIGNVAGADAILGSWKPGMEIDQLANGSTPRRSYIGPATLARAVHRLTQAERLPDVINIAAPGAVSMGGLLDAAGLAWRPRPAHPGVIPEVCLSTERLEDHGDFAPEDSTAAGMIAEWQRFGEHAMKDLS